MLFDLWRRLRYRKITVRVTQGESLTYHDPIGKPIPREDIEKAHAYLREKWGEEPTEERHA